MTLKGRVEETDRGYIWIAESNSCKSCKELSGKKYNNTDKIPQKPHPNCKCRIEIDTNKIETESKNKKAENSFYTKYRTAVMIYKLWQILNQARRNKLLLDNGIPIYAYVKNEPIAKNFWSLASKQFQDSYDFIKINGKTYKSTEELIKDKNLYRFKDDIKNKIKSQFQKNDVLGVYLHENSIVSKAIENSQEFKEFLQNNINDIKTNESIKQTSIAFKKELSPDLYHAFGKVQVLESKIDNINNCITTYILDTYDFNPNEGGIIEMARKIQNVKMLTPYYTIIKVITKTNKVL